MILSCFYLFLHFFPNLLRMMMLQLWATDSTNSSIFSSVQKHPKPWKSSQGSDCSETSKLQEHNMLKLIPVNCAISRVRLLTHTSLHLYPQQAKLLLCCKQPPRKYRTCQPPPFPRETIHRGYTWRTFPSPVPKRCLPALEWMRLWWFSLCLILWNARRNGLHSCSAQKASKGAGIYNDRSSN